MLTEEQIQRYARQILLKPVGGKGQEKLAAAEVIVSGEGLAAEIAATYLAAGGSKVTPLPWERVPEGRVRVRPKSTGQRYWVVCGRALIRPSGPPSPPRGEGLLQWSDCADCLTAIEAALQPLPPETEVLAGTLTAFVYQRLALGLGPTSGAIAIGADGSIHDATPITCEAHR